MDKRASLVFIVGVLSLGGCHRAPLQVSDGGAPLPHRSDGLPGSVDGDVPAPWVCETLPEGTTTCRTRGGLPPGSGWRCHQLNGVWYCYGEGGASVEGWSCALQAAIGLSRCSKPDGAGDHPPGGGHWVCWKGSKFEGTVCEKTSLAPSRPTLSGGPCRPGQRMWCDGLQYSGWGQVLCDPVTLRWRVKVNDAGQPVLDCREDLAQGKRPDTLCACYHFFLNPACCERLDCVLPDGSEGDACPPGPGGFCSYCNPLVPSTACSEPGAHCVTTNSHETFCARLCDASSPCPPGHECMTVKLRGTKTTQQCVPTDHSCYF